MWNSRSLTGRPIWMRFLIVKKQVSAAKIKWLFLGFCWGFLISRVREKSLSEPGVSCVFYLGNRRLHLLPFSFLSLCLVERAQCTMSCKVCSRTVWVGSSLWNGPRTRLQHFRVRPAFAVRKHRSRLTEVRTGLPWIRSPVCAPWACAACACFGFCPVIV